MTATVMTIVKPFIPAFFAVSMLIISSGCATLPNVSEMINGVDTGHEQRQIVSAKGKVSPQKSKAIMERLKQSVDPTDILERHTTVVESITTSPLTKGNKVTLLADGLAAYTAMFKAIQNAQGEINLESYIIEDDETGRKFADLLTNDEVNAVILNREFAVEMETMFTRDLADSKQIHWDEWKERPYLPRAREWLLNLFIRWL